MNILPIDQRGATFARAVAKLSKLMGISPEQVKEQFLMSWKTLRTVKILQDSNRNYVLDIVSNNTNTDNAFEVRLKNNDLFFASAISSKVARYVSSQWNPVPPMTNEDPEIFAKANESVSIAKVWNGAKLSLNTGALERFSDLDMQGCRFTGNRVLATGGLMPEFGPSDAQRGFQQLEPNVILSGKDDNKFTYQLGPGSISALTPTTGDNYLVLEIQGINVYNAAEAASRYLNGPAQQLTF